MADQSSRQKINLFWDEQDMCRNCWGGGSATVSPEAQDGSQNINWIHAYQASYTAPLTSKILVRSRFWRRQPQLRQPARRVRPLDRPHRRTGGFDSGPGVSIDVLGPGALVHAALPRLALVRHRRAEPEGRLSRPINNVSTRNYQRGDGLQYRFSNGVPNQITMLLNDFTEKARVRNIGIFAQDRWTIRRVTLEGGMRYENAEEQLDPSR